MAQITNSTGDIKVMNDKGNIKWFCKKIVEDKQLMKTMKYEVVNAPDSFPPVENVPVDYTPNETKTDTDFTPEIEPEIVESKFRTEVKKEQEKRSYKSRK